MPTATRNVQGRTARIGFALIGVLLIAVNLRVSFVSVGPVLANISGDLGLSSAAAGFLTGLPLIAFAVFSPVAPGFASRLGLDRALWMSLLFLASGIVLRSLPVPGFIWAGTALIGLAIAFLNVLVPSLVKRDFPAKVSRVTGSYTATQAAFAAMGGGRRRARGANVPGGMAACPGYLGRTGAHRHGGAPAVAAPVPVRHHDRR
ncbi:hypothetical protein AAIH32_14695 [Pseudarthrobacter oxydans]|uniref:hypothetical protein n=1 Tax=Pseudarthrobacter oxydans TaxID=1671 RepID=UPI003D2DF4E3